MPFEKVIRKLKDEIKNLENYNDIKIKDNVLFDIRSAEFFLLGFATQLIEDKDIYPNAFEKEVLSIPLIENEKLNIHELYRLYLKDYPAFKEYITCLEK